MKIWKKIFLSSMILFIFIFNIAGIYIIESIYNRNMQIAIQSSIYDERNIQNSIYLNSEVLSEYSTEQFWSLLKNYIYEENTSIANIEILDSTGKVLLDTSNLQIEGARPEISDAQLNTAHFILRDISGNNYIFVSSKMSIKGNLYTLVVAENINYLQNDKIYNFKMFGVLNIIVIILLGLGMYIVSKRITRPIEELKEIAQKVKDKDFSGRVDKIGDDEVGELALIFNSMMQVIEDNIDELESLNETKQRFINNLTHEMKTPITSIIGYSDLLLKSNINEESKLKALGYINSQGKRLEKLSGVLIRLIMIQNQKIDLRSISIAGIVNDSIAVLKYKLEFAKIKIVDDVKEAQVVCDKDLVEVLVINIIDNAIKASEEQTTINVIGSLKNNKYSLEIIDEGKGISKKDLEKIKEPFYMVDKSRAESNKNIGLGLAICTEICKRNNIGFYIESELGKGTKVTLVFEVE
ncbi:MAG: ATP-binding protein [Sarcina sp.]